MYPEIALQVRSLQMRAARNGAASAELARSITWDGSKQSYMIARLLVGRSLQDDCYRAYGYFRWADDVVDDIAQSRDERMAFIQRQRELIDRQYRRERPAHLLPEERIIADLITHDSREGSGLQSFIRNFLAIIEFDAQRKGECISQAALSWYSRTLGVAVTDAIEHFIGNGYPYPDTPDRYLAATAAHITHMLRDMVTDVPQGYINIPREYMQEHNFRPDEVDCLPMRLWVLERVGLARAYFRAGKRYLDRLGHLPSKIAGYLYCARFEGVLDAIEREGYVLRAAYNERKSLGTLLKMAWLILSVCMQHLTRGIPARFPVELARRDCL